jgi:hypothetical protein
MEQITDESLFLCLSDSDPDILRSTSSILRMVIAVRTSSKEYLALALLC